MTEEFNPYSLDNPQNEQQEEMKRKAREIASLHLAVFDSDAGRKLLEHWEAMTIQRPVVTANSTRFGAGIREGQNDFVRQVKAQIKLAKEL